ncbi:MAG: hypothetical protein FJ265_05715 [Planctomycetes bacterium]|nr:hypothetical protein [Planctomycetota bacterium]
MASSPAERPAAQSSLAFALQELTACWDQGYEALSRGDLDRVAALLDLADDHLRALPAEGGDGAEAGLRERAVAARGRLEHAVQTGLGGLRDELVRVRQGSRVLQGYRRGLAGRGQRVEKSV